MRRYPQGSPRHSLPSNDAVPGWARVVLYAIAIVAPFGALAAGHLTGEETLALAVGLIGAVGPAVAIGYQRKQADEDGAHFRAGYAEGVAQRVAREARPVVDSPQAGEHRGTPSTSANDGGPLDGPHNRRHHP